jgi:hypothetical protein
MWIQRRIIIPLAKSLFSMGDQKYMSIGHNIRISWEQNREGGMKVGHLTALGEDFMITPYPIPSITLHVNFMQTILVQQMGKMT